MRRFSIRSGLVVLILSAPTLASAECECLCLGDRPVGRCTQSFEQPPICQQICTPSVGRALVTPGLDRGLDTGGLYGATSGTPAEREALARQFGLGGGRGPNSAFLPR